MFLFSSASMSLRCCSWNWAFGLPITEGGIGAIIVPNLGCDIILIGYENATVEDGPWIITLDASSYMSVMKHAKNRTLREEVYRAFISRASNGDLDNTEIINQILKLRLEKAKLLGYNNYAEVSMAMKMASVEKVEELLEKLRSASWDPAAKDLEDLNDFCKSQGSPEAGDLNHWDITFWTLSSHAACLQEELRPYFLLPRVMDGLFNLVNMLFGINVEPADGLAPVTLSSLAFPFTFVPAPKSGGAWMGGVVSRSRILSRDGANARLPVAHIVFNQMPPVGDKPSLMTFRELMKIYGSIVPNIYFYRSKVTIRRVFGIDYLLLLSVETVFHEFGHALQHMLTKQDEGLLAGLRGIEWDAMELPSQFMENWCYHRYDDVFAMILEPSILAAKPSNLSTLVSKTNTEDRMFFAIAIFGGPLSVRCA
ncbi:putative cytosolic oligopeptidase A [Capsicum chinense]|nr:putative cytosolic oligopeptidase A [Capsicum chinense]